MFVIIFGLPFNTAYVFNTQTKKSINENPSENTDMNIIDGMNSVNKKTCKN